MSAGSLGGVQGVSGLSSLRGVNRPYQPSSGLGAWSSSAHTGPFGAPSSAPAAAEPRSLVVAHARRKWYAVFEPVVQRGIYRNWDEVRSCVVGHSGNVHKGFHTEAAALTWLQQQEVDLQEKEATLELPRQEMLAAAATAAAAAKVAAAAVDAAAAAAATSSIPQGDNHATGTSGSGSRRHRVAQAATLEAVSRIRSGASASTSSRRASSASVKLVAPAAPPRPKPWETSVLVLPGLAAEPTRQYYRKWYAVRFVEGGHPGVYTTWEEAQEVISASQYAEHQSFESQEEAILYAFGPEHLEHLLPHAAAADRSDDGTGSDSDVYGDADPGAASHYLPADADGDAASWHDAASHSPDRNLSDVDASWDWDPSYFTPPPYAMVPAAPHAVPAGGEVAAPGATARSRHSGLPLPVPAARDSPLPPFVSPAARSEAPVTFSGSSPSASLSLSGWLHPVVAPSAAVMQGPPCVEADQKHQLQIPDELPTTSPPMSHSEAISQGPASSCSSSSSSSFSSLSPSPFSSPRSTPSGTAGAFTPQSEYDRMAAMLVDPPRRRPGRPRKNPLPQPQDPTTVPVKRGRGRPTKAEAVARAAAAAVAAAAEEAAAKAAAEAEASRLEPYSFETLGTSGAPDPGREYILAFDISSGEAVEGGPSCSDASGDGSGQMAFSALLLDAADQSMVACSVDVLQCRHPHEAPYQALVSCLKEAVGMGLTKVRIMGPGLPGYDPPQPQLPTQAAAGAAAVSDSRSARRQRRHALPEEISAGDSAAAPRQQRQQPGEETEAFRVRFGAEDRPLLPESVQPLQAEVIQLVRCLLKVDVHEDRAALARAADAADLALRVRRLAAEWAPRMSVAGLVELMQAAEAERDRLLRCYSPTDSPAAARRGESRSGPSSYTALVPASASIDSFSAALLQLLYGHTGCTAAHLPARASVPAAAVGAGQEPQPRRQAFVLQLLHRELQGLQDQRREREEQELDRRLRLRRAQQLQQQAERKRQRAQAREQEQEEQEHFNERALTTVAAGRQAAGRAEQPLRKTYAAAPSRIARQEPQRAVARKLTPPGLSGGGGNTAERSGRTVEARVEVGAAVPPSALQRAVADQSSIVLEGGRPGEGRSGRRGPLRGVAPG